MVANRRYRALRWTGSGRAGAGFTLLELLLALAVAGVLASLAYASYSSAVQKTRVAQAAADIGELEMAIERYHGRHGFRYPESLDDVGGGSRRDPWGNPYHYTLLAGTRGHGAARKDRRLNPLNADYDLFSAGRDGVFKPQISQKDSLDDVIRARGGAYIGLAEDF